MQQQQQQNTVLIPSQLKTNHTMGMLSVIKQTFFFFFGLNFEDEAQWDDLKSLDETDPVQ